jgi:hypothetical protein
MPSAVEKNAFRLDLARTLVTSVLATIAATITATWTASGIVADFDRRLSVVEARQQYDGQTLTDIRTDVREVRAMLAGRGSQP